MRIGSLFSGIGTMDLGLELSGVGHTVWQCEADPFCRSILRKWWGVPCYNDVREIGRDTLEPVDLLCGGFPCQDVSGAGKGAGLTADRSGLWSEFARLVSELEPAWVIVENVASGARQWVDQVSSELLQQGYATLSIPLSAEACGAPHRRERVYVVAYSERVTLRNKRQRRPGGRPGPVCAPRDALPLHTSGEEAATRPAVHVPERWSPEPPVCGVAAGPATRLDAARLRALGNANPPQAYETIGWVVRELACI